MLLDVTKLARGVGSSSKKTSLNEDLIGQGKGK